MTCGVGMEKSTDEALGCDVGRKSQIRIPTSQGWSQASSKTNLVAANELENENIRLCVTRIIRRIDLRRKMSRTK